MVTERNYFIKPDRKWTLFLVLLAIIISVYPVLMYTGLDFTNTYREQILSIGYKGNIVVLIGVLFSIGLVILKKTKYLIVLVLFSVGLAFLSNNYFPKMLILIGIFVPTLVHVYLFTLLFIIYGARKSKSRSGVYLAIIMALVPFVVAYMPIEFIHYKPTQETLAAFMSSGMMSLSSKIAELLNEFQNGKFIVLSESGIRIQAFIAFAYTYHYLNWFSKTSIIGWRKSITKKNGILVLVLWAIAISIYIYDFKTGFISFFLLGFLHVFLEFPLNVITIKELFTKPESNNFIKKRK